MYLPSHDLHAGATLHSERVLALFRKSEDAKHSHAPAEHKIGCREAGFDQDLKAKSKTAAPYPDEVSQSTTEALQPWQHKLVSSARQLSSAAPEFPNIDPEMTPQVRGST